MNMAVIIDLNDPTIRVTTVTEAELEKLPGCPGCGGKCVMPDCEVCIGKRFCGTCSTDSHHGNKAFIANHEDGEGDDLLG